jgi:hypothetical protein
MYTVELLSSIDSEIARLKEVHALLVGDNGHRTPRKVKPAKKRHTMSAAGRAAIAAAQRKRWAAQKKAAKKAV